MDKHKPREVRLNPIFQRIGHFVSQFFITFFIFGFWSLVLFLTIEEFKEPNSQPNWVALIFLFLFTIVNFYVIFKLIKRIKIIFASKVYLNIKNGQTWMTGYPVEISLNIPDRRYLKSVKLSLICEEKTFYKRGTNISCDTENVCKIDIAEVDLKNSAMNIKYFLPLDVMPTFSSSHNKIKWSISVSLINHKNELLQDLYEIKIVNNDKSL